MIFCKYEAPQYITGCKYPFYGQIQGQIPGKGMCVWATEVLSGVHELGSRYFPVSIRWDWGQNSCPHLWAHYNRRAIIWGQIWGQRKLKSLILSGLSETFRRLQKSAKNPEGCLIGSFYITTINYK